MADAAGAAPEIRFDDGAAYEGFMGVWSRIAGERFLGWLAPAPGGRWVDVGCGNGAFTELILDRAAPRTVDGIDPSPEQVAFAHARLRARGARFAVGDAMALPWADAAFDAAVMALVVFFVPDPARGVAEMARVTAPGGSVSAYAWDMLGAGFPYAVLHEEMRALGAPAIAPPSADASRLDAMQALWADAGLVDVDGCAIAVTRTFESFEAFWQVARSGPRIAPRVGTLDDAGVARLKERVRARLAADADGRVTVAASANAVRGRVPAAKRNRA